MEEKRNVPGAAMLPIGPNDPQRFLVLVPIRTERVIGLVLMTDPKNPDAPMEQIAKVSERQLRDLGRACGEVADWFHEHTA